MNPLTPNRPMAREETMEKTGNLPKTFQKMLGQLKKLDDELGITLRPYGDKKEIWERGKRKERETLLDQIWQSWPRKTVLNKDILQMRGNALKNPEVKTVLKKSNIRIEDCALIDLAWDEEYIGKEHDCPAHCSPEDIRNIFVGGGWGNSWRMKYRYEWGGPKDPVKILFEKSNNSRFKIVGVIQMFPREKKAA
jgi:hypothetical protein